MNITNSQREVLAAVGEQDARKGSHSLTIARKMRHLKRPSQRPQWQRLLRELHRINREHRQQRERD